MCTSTRVLTVRRAGSVYTSISVLAVRRAGCISAHLSSLVQEQDKIKPETDDSFQEGPELESVMHEVELNQCTTSGEINLESSVAVLVFKDHFNEWPKVIHNS